MEITLRNSDLKAIIDDADAPLVEERKWYLRRWQHLNYVFAYSYSDSLPKMIYLHRLLLAITTVPTLQGDHIDGNPLNNRRDNLRIVTPSQQAQNKKVYKNSRSGLRGVYWDVANNRWRAKVRLNGKQVFSSYFEDFASACSAVETARRTYFTHAIEGRL